jgi:hypothetical protein
VLTPREAAALEAALDERIDVAPAGRLALDPAAELELDAFRTERRIEWATQTRTQGEILAAFARHCADELDDVEVVTVEPSLLVVRWRLETSRLELRAGFLGWEQLASETPTMLLGDTEADLEALVERFVADAELRSRIAVYDLGRLEKLGAVRASPFVYFEWFLRDAYGVKILPASAFTQGLIDRGIISLGMG